jgi:hypothetical protein
MSHVFALSYKNNRHMWACKREKSNAVKIRDPSVFFLKNGAGALPFIKKEKTERLQNTLTESEAEQAQLKNNTTRGELRTWFQVDGLSPSPP